MVQFLVRRLIFMIPVLIGILAVTFALARLIPGDPCSAMLGERYTPEKCAEFTREFGLDQPIPIQFERYLVQIVQGNFGTSIRESRPVTAVISERLPTTVELALGAMLFASILGILLGIVSAVRHNTSVDVVTMIGANIGVSMPVFWIGLMLAYLFALVLRNTPFFIPPSGRLSAGVGLPSLIEVWHLQNANGFVQFVANYLSHSYILYSLFTLNLEVLKDAVWHLILPSIAVGTIPLAIIARLTRSSLLEVLGQDYIRTARAKGLKTRMVLFRHALRSALIPIVTIIGLQTGSLLSGAVLTETVFALPGIGTRLVSAIEGRDYPVVQGFTVVVALIFALVNILVDLSYAYLDPRVRVQ